MEGFKQYKAIFNQKNTQAACNDPCGAYLTVEDIYNAVKSSGCSQWTLNTLFLQDFITSGLITACCLKCLSLVPYYVAQMKCCMQKWDRHDNQGGGTEVINMCQQLISVVSTSLHHSMANVQSMVQFVGIVVCSTPTDQIY